MHIRNRLFNNMSRGTYCPANVGLGLTRKTLLTATIVGVALCACGKSEAPISTADRVKIVEEKQKTDSTFYLEKKTTEATSNKPIADLPAVPATAQADQSKALAKM